MAATSEKTTIRHWATLATAVPNAYTTVFNATAALVFTDITAAANNSTTADTTITGVVGDNVYLGMASNRFDFARFVFSTSPAGGVRTWEYWDGAAWSALSPTAVTGNLNLTGATHEFSWTPNANWATTAVNGVTNYWIRGRVTTLYTTAGIGSYFTPGVIPVLSQMTIDAPENTTRTIKSAVLKFDYHVDSRNVAVVQSQTRVSVKLGAAALSYIMDSSADIASGAAQTNTSLMMDCTSYFVSNFGSGTTQTFDVTFSACQNISTLGLTTAVSLEGFGVELILTYSADESAQTTRVKTVWIPLESNTTALTTSLASMGTSQIPALDTFCPESTKVYKEIMLVVQGCPYSGSAGARTLSYALDAAAAIDIVTMTDTTDFRSQSDVFYVDLSAMTTNATHDLKFKTSSTSFGPYNHLVAYLMVTYTYDHSASTTILNSILQTGSSISDNVLGTAGTATAFRFEINIQEPATITLAQSAVLFRWDMDINATAPTPNIKLGSQTSRAYTPGAVTTIRGDIQAMQRLDSGSAQGAAITIARGMQNLDTQFFSSIQRSYIPTALLFLNYTSAKSSLGAHLHAHTVIEFIRGMNNGATIVVGVDTSATMVPTITPSSFWINSMGYWLNWYDTTFASQYSHGLHIAAQIQSAELGGVGYEPIFDILGTHFDVGILAASKYSNKTKRFKRWANDWNSANLLNPKTSRPYVFYTAGNNGGLIPMLMSMVTYHGIIFTASGTVINYTGDGSGITVTVHRSDTGEKIATATTAVGGGYTVTECFDSSVQHFSEARQDGTHLGRSELYTPA